MPSLPPSALPLLLLLPLFLTPTARADVLLGTLSATDPSRPVSARVFAVDVRTLRLSSFTYDARGPPALFWVDTRAPRPSAAGRPTFNASCARSVPVPSADGTQDILVHLPVPLPSVAYFSLWCPSCNRSRAGLVLDPALARRASPASRKCPASSPPKPARVRLGRLSDDAGHGIAGTVFALDASTLAIDGFRYDGKGPAAVFWIDEGAAPTTAGLPALDQASCTVLDTIPRYDGDDVIAELPNGRQLSSVGYFSIWCELFAVSFGGLAIPPAKVANLPAAEPKCSQAASVADKEVRIGKLSNLAAHGVAGTVFALNSRTLRIKNFRYDGSGPAAVFWVGRGEPDGNGAIPLGRKDCAAQEALPAFSGEDVDLELPSNLELASIDYLSVWCEQFAVDFGSVSIDPSTLKGVPVLNSPLCDLDAAADSEPFPVQDGYNCEELSDSFQVRWAVDESNIKIELVGRIKSGEYMGFGPSGSAKKTSMIGSDVVIAYKDGKDFVAVDYFMNKKNPCTAGKGVCPDVDLSPKGGSNDVSAVSGKRAGDLTVVRYTRPLSASDESFDKAISISDSMFVSWAIGPLDPGSKRPLFHIREMSFPTNNVKIDFGRSVSNGCASKLVVVGEEVATVPGFERPTISGTTKITARIGPSGGTRGYSGITGGPSWGIAWYMSPTGQTGKDVLIPAIAVIRGKTYTFTVQGGLDDGSGKAFHPLYITSSPKGGFAVLSPKERAKQTIYAGIEDIVKDPDGSVTSFRATAVGALCDISSSLVGDTADVRSWADYFKTLDTSCSQDEAIVSNSGELIWTVPADAPDVLYYQCVTHANLGYNLIVFDEGKVDEDILTEANGGGKLDGESGTGDVGNSDGDGSSDGDEGKRRCKLTFKGEEKVFGGCRKGLDGDVELYWTLREASGEIDTLFRAPTNGGYIGFGWGYSEMVGSHVVIAFEDLSGKGVIDSYFMESKSSEGVQRNDSLKLIEKDVEVDAGFVTGFFTRKLEVAGVTAIASGETSAIWAVGAQPRTPTELTKHTVRSPAVFDISSSSTDSAESEDGDSLGDGASGAPGDEDIVSPSPEGDVAPENDEIITPSPEDGGGHENDETTTASPEDGGDSESSENEKCSAFFKGESRGFDGCEKGLDGDMDLYWTLREADGEIDTLFRAPSRGGYVGFGWGYSSMIGSHVVVAFMDASGANVIDSYFLEGRSTEGVQPNGTLQLVEKEMEIRGDSVTGFFTRKLEVEGVPTISGPKLNAIWAVGAVPNTPTALTRHQVRSHRAFDLFTAPVEGIDGDNDASNDGAIEDGDSEEDFSDDSGSPGASPEESHSDGTMAEGEDISDNPETDNCSVLFKGEERTYDGCKKSLEGDVDVYWRLREDDGEIDTLFRAPNAKGVGGYVSFGWGYSGMLDSHVVIAFSDSVGEGVIDTYFLKDRTPEGVQPNETLSLVDKDVEVTESFVAGAFTRKLELDGLPPISKGSMSAIWAVGPQPKSGTALAEHRVGASGILDLPSTPGTDVSEGEDRNCSVIFKDEERIFSGCRKNLTHNAELYWTVREEDGEIDTLFRSRTDGYVGFGWGYSKMVGSNVVIALQDSEGTVRIGDFLMESKDTEGVQPNDRQKLTNSEASIDGEYLAGVFTRKLDVEGLPVIRVGEIDAIWAVGRRPKSKSGRELEKHDDHAIGKIDISRNFGTVASGGGTSTFYIVHGVLMAVAWFVLTPTAMITMRYFKEFNPATFQLHRAFNVVSVALVLAAFIMGLARGSRSETAHLVIGCIVFSLAILQALGGLLRPRKNSRGRQPWAFVHMLSGYATHGLGMANVWVGLGVIDADVGYYIVCGVLVGIYVLAQIGFGLLPGRFPVREREEQFPFPDETAGTPVASSLTP